MTLRVLWKRCILACCLLGLGGSVAWALEESVAMRVLARKLPVAEARILPEAGWRGKVYPPRDRPPFRESRGEWVHVLSNVSQACTDDLAAHVALYTGQVMPVLQEIFGRENGQSKPVRLFAYRRKEDAPRWWEYEKKGHRIWHDADQRSIHWILRENEEGVWTAEGDMPDVQYHLVRMLLRRFLTPDRFVEDDFKAAPLDVHYGSRLESLDGFGDTSWQSGGEHPAMAEVRSFQEMQVRTTVATLMEWRRAAGLAEGGGEADLNRLRQILSSSGGYRGTVRDRRRRHHVERTDARARIEERILQMDPRNRTPKAMADSWNQEFDDWRKKAEGWDDLEEAERDSLAARLWDLLRFWERFLGGDTPRPDAPFARQPSQRGSRTRNPNDNRRRPTVPPTFEEGVAGLLGRAWDPYLKPEANLAFAQMAFHPLLLVHPHDLRFDPLRPVDPYAGMYLDAEASPSANGNDPRGVWFDARTLVENGLFHGELALNTRGQGFLLVSFLLNDGAGAELLRELVLSMRNTGQFYRYEELDKAWLAYLERGVLRTAGGRGVDVKSMRAAYATIREPEAREVDFDAPPSWRTLAGNPSVSGTWLDGESRVRVSQAGNRLSLYGVAENGERLFRGRATVSAQGVVEGVVEYPRGNRTETVRARMAPDGRSLHPLPVAESEAAGLLHTPWTRTE